MTSQEIRTLTDQYIMHTYGRFPVAIDHGEGARLYRHRRAGSTSTSPAGLASQIWDMAISPG